MSFDLSVDILNLPVNLIIKKVRICQDVYFVEREVKSGKTVFSEESGFVYDTNLRFVNSLEDILFIKGARLMKKSFLDVYKNMFFGCEDYFDIIQDNEIDDIDGLANSGLSSDDIILLKYNYSSEVFTDLDNNYLEHMIRFNGSCYMVTSRDYDIRGLKKFLGERADILVSECAAIPYYNLRDGDSGDEVYINFYVRVPGEKASLIPKNTFAELPAEIIDISKFKIL